MAAVVQDVTTTIVPNAATVRNVQVVVAALNWQCYCRVMNGATRVRDVKIQQGTTDQFTIQPGESVDAFATGTGVVGVTVT